MPESTVAAIITKVENNIKYIMLIRRNTEPYKNYWALPGGHINPNENVKDAVVREVKEEIGLDFEPEFFCYLDEIIPEKDVHAVVNIFEGNVNGKLQLAKDEILEASWFPISHAKSMKLGFFHNRVIEKYSNNISNDSKTEILAEYSALRNEIIKRMEFRHQLLTFTLIAAGTILSFGAKEGITLILLIYPLLALFLAIAWSQSDIRAGEIGDFIRINIEDKLKGICWQSYIKKIKTSEQKNLLQKTTQLSAQGVFLFTEILALVLAAPKITFTIQEIILLFFDLVAIVFTIYVIGRRRSKKYVGH